MLFARFEKRHRHLAAVWQRLIQHPAGKTLASARKLLDIHVALALAAVIVILHLALLGASLGDYRVTIDSAYHVAMARQWIDHFPALWDHVNFGPHGRPNLQGPLQPLLIGAIAKLLPSRSNYVLSNSILALAQWIAATLSAGFFAFELGGEWASLITVSLFTGAAFTSSSYAAGIPSGWLFIFTAWAIWFCISGRPYTAAVVTSLAVYVHIAGLAMAPFAIFVATLCARRFKDFFKIGFVSLILTLPYIVHVLYYLNWMTSVKSHSALLFDPLLDILGTIAMVVVLRHPLKQPFLSALLLAPFVWLLHDPGRLILQWGLGASVAAGVVLASAMSKMANARGAAAAGFFTAGIATVFPVGIPALAPEITWDCGLHYPRAIDWTQSERLAHQLEQTSLAKRLVADYQPALCPALAVFADLSCQKGHWIEVQPRHDPADDMPVYDKAYILPLQRGDPMLAELKERRVLMVRGGVSNDSIVIFLRELPLNPLEGQMIQVIGDESAWLARNVAANSITMADWQSVMSEKGEEQHRRQLEEQRTHVAHVQLACLVLADILQISDPVEARAMERAARGFGVLASFLSDGFAADYIGDSRIGTLRQQFRDLSKMGEAGSELAMPVLLRELDGVLATALDNKGDTFAERPAGDLLPWL